MASRIQALAALWTVIAMIPAAYGQENATDKEPLKFAPLRDLARSGQSASYDRDARLKVVLVEPGRGIVGRPMNFEVVVENTGTRASGKETGLIVEFQFARRTEAYGLMVGELAPKAKRTHSFQYVPHGRLTHVRVHPGSWDKTATTTGVYSVEMERAPGVAGGSFAKVWADYDPRTPLTEYLPKSPVFAKVQRPKLPATLADVPEVSFADHLPHTMPAVSAELHFITTIEKIHHVNQKKMDAYMELMREHRPDLAGLPFLLGDACRLKGETGKQFAVETAKIREVQRNFMTIDHLVQQSDLTPPREPKGPQERRGNGLIISALQSFDSKEWPREGLGQFSANVRVAAMMQMLTQESREDRLEMVTYLDRLTEVDATRALAKLAIYSEERQVRSAAVQALKSRRGRDYTDILVSGLGYPWPTVAQRSSEAVVQLGRTDLVSELIDMLGHNDPRAPRLHAVNGKSTKVVKEVVRINHLHNCLLCHAPASSGEGNQLVVESDLTSQIPVPSSPIVQYYGGTVVPDMLVRFDVTYLRQDFTMNLPVKDTKPWPEIQRFDFVVRTRAVADQEARTIAELLQQSREKGLSPYQLAALTALRELTGRDAEPTPAAWKRVLGK
jgi:hypothetical protein